MIAQGFGISNFRKVRKNIKKITVAVKYLQSKTMLLLYFHY